MVFTCLILLPVSVFAATSELSLSGNRRSVNILERSAETPHWIVYMPGSGCGLFDVSGSRWIHWLKEAHDYNLLVTNKAGIGIDGDCRRDEYERSSLRSQRIEDTLVALRTYVPRDAKITLVSESEGGYIAPDIAVADSRVQSTILISSGTRSWLDEEIMLADPENRPRVQTLMNTEVRGSDSLDKFYDGMSYAQLNSYDTDATVSALRKLKIPVLSMQGGRDRNIWVGGTVSDLQSLIAEGKSNIAYRIFANAHHGLACQGTCAQAKLNRHLCRTILDFVGRSLND